MLEHITVEEARSQIRSIVVPQTPREIPLAEAVGLILAEDVVSAISVPMMATSKMDGYAVSTGDFLDRCDEGCEKTFGVTGRVTAGEVYAEPIRVGFAIRIMTGAPVPERLDAVIPYEEVEVTSGDGSIGSLIVYDGLLTEGMNIQPAGGDLAQDDVVAHAGTVLDPTIIGAIGTAGHASVSVYARPRVAIFSTGDELVPLGEELSPGKIHNSNVAALSAGVMAAGGEPVALSIVSDDRASIREALESVAGYDLALMTGGSADGDHDYGLLALSDSGAALYHGVRMSPGGTHSFGVVSGTPVFVLPGSPGGALIVFDVLVRGAIAVLRGDTYERPGAIVSALLENPEAISRSSRKRGGHVESSFDGADATADGQMPATLYYQRGWFSLTEAGVPSVRVLERGGASRYADLDTGNCIVEYERGDHEDGTERLVRCIPSALGGGFTWI